MSHLQTLSSVQVVLLAAQFISDVDVESLQIIAAERKDVLTKDIIYRLLLTLYPTDYTARSALSALLKNIESEFHNISSIDKEIDVRSIAKLPASVLSQYAEQLHLDNISSTLDKTFGTPLAQFVVQWVHKLEINDDNIEDTTRLVDEFSADSIELDLWARTYLVPIVRLRYHFYPDVLDVIGLKELELIYGLAGVKELLKQTRQSSHKVNVARDLDQLVGPWINGGYEAAKRAASNVSSFRKTASWSDVNEWLLATSFDDFSLAAKAILEWNGPSSTLDESESDMQNLDYAQTGMAVIYADSDISGTSIGLLRQLLQRVKQISGFQTRQSLLSGTESDTSAGSFDVSETNLLHSLLLKNDNELTRVADVSVAFLTGVLDTAEVLWRYKIPLKIDDIAKTCLSKSEHRQKQELRRILQQVPRLTSMNSDWRTIRQELLWLHSWRSDSESADTKPKARTYLCQISLEYLETEILNSMLAASQYDSVKALYADSESMYLPSSHVEDQIVGAIYSAYDNASNGNRTRGGMKRASELLSTFRAQFPQSQRLKEIDHLIKATHSLSFYHLTLQHGVPFQPVNIRVHKDPISLIGMVLDQNQKAYTKLDDLLEIGRNLVLARLKDSSTDLDDAGNLQSRIFDAEHRITYLAITSALSNNDFDTVYSYITTRLSTSLQNPTADYVDDSSWRAAYAAGRYRPPSSPKPLHSRIASLSQRMDLLSLALTLTPSSEYLSEILGTWRRCEEEMDNLKSQALEEERAFEGHSGMIPGGFGLEEREQDAAETKQALARRALAGNSATYEEQAPVGLFDVARGAATALRKSAFPLRSGPGSELKISSASRQHSMASTQLVMNQDDAGRVRKRDMVSNMVTGGLVSGMSWMLGAEPVHQPQQHDDSE